MPRFDSFDIVARAAGQLRRITKLRFGHDGSIYVFFPGFAKSGGVLCHARLSAGSPAERQLDLSDGGKVSVHLVKYSHHPDGRAHFSQDGKVKTEIKRQSVPLKDQRGHLFTIQIQNIESFPVLQEPKQKQLTLELPNAIRALKITGWRFHISDLAIPASTPASALAAGIQFPDGTRRQGFIVAPPVGATFDDVALFVAVEETPFLSPDNAAQLIFMGGYDDLSVALDHSKDSGFLAFAYPCSDFGKLKDRIGSIDLPSVHK